MTEREFTAAIREWLDPREWVVLPQVRNQTGFNRRVRTADAVAVSCYPSKGIGVHGFEFKDSRADWLRELADGSKSDEIGRFCRQWSLVVSDPAVVADGELPDAWGLVVVQDGAAKVKKKAPHREAAEPTWAFFAALMRAASQAIPEAEVEQRVKAAVSAEQTRAWREYQERRQKDRAADQEQERSAWGRIRAFEEASGVKIESYGGAGDARRIGQAVRLVRQGGLDRLTGARNLVAALLADIDRVRAEAGVPDQPTEGE